MKIIGPKGLEDGRVCLLLQLGYKSLFSKIWIHGAGLFCVQPCWDNFGSNLIWIGIWRIWLWWSI